jgi:hypothetical protein
VKTCKPQGSQRESKSSLGVAQGEKKGWNWGEGLFRKNRETMKETTTFVAHVFCIVVFSSPSSSSSLSFCPPAVDESSPNRKRIERQ